MKASMVSGLLSWAEITSLDPDISAQLKISEDLGGDSFLSLQTHN